jgi:hypothetical protein
MGRRIVTVFAVLTFVSVGCAGQRTDAPNLASPVAAVTARELSGTWRGETWAVPGAASHGTETRTTSSSGRRGERGAARSAYPTRNTNVGSQPEACVNAANAGPNSSLRPSI